MSALLALATTTVAVAAFVVRLGTILAEVAVAVCGMLVPDGVLAFTCNIKVKLAGGLVARVPLSVQVIVGGAVQVQVPGGVIDTNVVFGGMVSASCTGDVAATGPRLVSVCV